MAKITENTLIADCLKLNPNAAEILLSAGMHCIGCAMAHGETIAEAVSAHIQGQCETQDGVPEQGYDLSDDNKDKVFVTHNFSFLPAFSI